MIPYDLYVLSLGRSKPTVELFLCRFGKGMEASAGDYPVPQFGDNPTLILSTAGELVDYLIGHPDEPYNIYYRNPDAKEAVRNAIVSFTTDGNMILGLTIKVSDPSPLEEYLKQMALTVDGKWGYWTVEQPPPLSSPEFVQIAKQAQNPKLAGSPY